MKTTVGGTGTSQMIQEQTRADLARDTRLTEVWGSPVHLCTPEVGWADTSCTARGDRAASEVDSQRTAVAVRSWDTWFLTYCWRCGVSLNTTVVAQVHRGSVLSPAVKITERDLGFALEFWQNSRGNLGIFLKISFPWKRNEDRGHYFSQ